uniref:Glycosyl hydrolase n=1 Tax=Solibacter usitatus (strain Ellin6076) TaxID=234267 RepID=Q022A7_SOLUE
MNLHRVFAILFAAGCLLRAQDGPKKVEDDDPRERQEWFYSQRAYPGISIPAGARLNAIRQVQRIDAAARARRLAAAPAAAAGLSPAITNDSAKWTLIGPQPTGAGTTSVTSGRVNAIAIDPRDNNVVYIGAAEGGVWKTTDGGVHWTPLTDTQPSLATGAIAIDPNHPDTVYVGTGEENFAGDSYYGAGILKSTDAGATWTNVVGPFLRDKIGSIAVQPINSQVVICASTTGIWRSADAGNSWSSVLVGTGVTVAFDPANDAGVYATVGNPNGSTLNGVYHSADSGLTWTPLRGAAPAALPVTSVGRMELAVSKAAPATVFVQIQDSSTANFGNLLGIYKSTDAGLTWNKLPISNALVQQWGPQLWYDNTIRVSPTDPNVIYAGALLIYRSLDGGNTWTLPAQTGPNGVLLHVDLHYLAFTADGSKLYIANDGGMYSTTESTAARINWTSLNNTLAITQFYPGMTIDPANPLKAVGGAQDNGTQRFSGDFSWTAVTCGDGGYAAIDPSVPGFAYGACQQIAVRRTLNLFDNSTAWVSAQYGLDQADPVQFIAPLVLDANNPKTLYFATYRVWQSTDEGGKWTAISPDLTGGKKGTIKTIATAPSDSNVLYAGTSNSKLQVTLDAQHGANASWIDRSAGLPPRTVTKIAVDPLNAATAYATFSGFPAGFGADSGGHVFKTSDSGATWTDISGNLPVVPVNDIVVDPDLPRTLYIATDAGVMQTSDGGATWSSLGTGLPVVVVQSLVLHRPSRVLRAGTHGRSVWDILVPVPGASQQPTIQTVAPSTLDAGSAATTLSVTGSNFRAGTALRWNGQNRPTTFVDSTHATVQIPASDLAAVGRGTLVAFNSETGGGPSNSVSVTIGPAPKFVAEGFVSAANPAGGSILAQRAIGSIFGTNLASQTAVADQLPPLPFTLGGTTLTIGGNIVPLFFVSPGQINFQVPFLSVTGPTTVPLLIQQGTLSSTVNVRIQPTAPALFTANAQGTGQGSVLIAGTASLAAPAGKFPGSRPVKPGEYISIYCTGLGDVNIRPTLGSPSPSQPVASTLATPTVTIGGIPATVSFSGLAPGFVGLYQVNVQIPAGITPGDAVPLALTISSLPANPVTIAIDAGV